MQLLCYGELAETRMYVCGGVGGGVGLFCVLAMAYSCKRDWYNDWASVECCQGDLCNYYVTVS